MHEKIIRLVTVLFLLSGCIICGPAQEAMDVQRQRETQEQAKLQQQRLEEAERVERNRADEKARQDAWIYGTNQQIFQKRRFPSTIIIPARSARHSLLLEPKSEDLIRYKDFLKSKNTGIFKLYPDLNCESKYTIKVNEDCENVIPFSSSYSFLHKSYGNEKFFDLRLKEGKLGVDGFLTQNIIVSIGDVPLENVTLSAEGMKLLREFKPETEDIKAQKQYAEIASNIFADGLIYGKAVSAQQNITYLVRLVPYRIHFKDISKSVFKGPDTQRQNDLLFVNYDSSRRDKIIALRVIRMEADNGLTILWKKLADKKSPKLKFSKVKNK